MSIKVMTRVWEHSCCKGSELLTLLALADWADDYGASWHSVENLSNKTRLTKRQQQRLTVQLTETPELYVVKNAGKHGANLYFVLSGLTREQIADTFCSQLQMPYDDADLEALSVVNREGGDILSPVTHRVKGMTSTRKGVTSGVKRGDMDVTRIVSKPKETSKKRQDSATKVAGPSNRPSLGNPGKKAQKSKKIVTSESEIDDPLFVWVAKKLKEVDPVLDYNDEDTSRYTWVLVSAIVQREKKLLALDDKEPLGAEHRKQVAARLDHPQRGFIAFYERVCKDCSLPTGKSTFKKYLWQWYEPQKAKRTGDLPAEDEYILVEEPGYMDGTFLPKRVHRSMLSTLKPGWRVKEGAL